MLMLMCPYCIDEAKKKGKQLFIGYYAYTFEECMTKNIACNICDQYDELYEVREMEDK